MGAVQTTQLTTPAEVTLSSDRRPGSWRDLLRGKWVFEVLGVEFFARLRVASLDLAYGHGLCFSREVGLDDVQRSLPTHTVLGLWNSVSMTSCRWGHSDHLESNGV